MRYRYTVTDHTTRKQQTYDSQKDASAAFNALESASIEKKSIVQHFMDQMFALPKAELQAIHAALAEKLNPAPQTPSPSAP